MISAASSTAPASGNGEIHARVLLFFVTAASAPTAAGTAMIGQCRPSHITNPNAALSKTVLAEKPAMAPLLLLAAEAKLQRISGMKIGARASAAAASAG